ncbi:MAG: ABC transporter substrate-binding protein [Deltaproteobacteria bacterium]|nr:ABC transporter substrate-binding protein [Deltaproteobacteria bacterium]
MKISILSFLLSIFLIIGACDKEKTLNELPYDTDKKPVKIGVFLPVSGAMEDLGRSAWLALQIANSIRPAPDDRRVDLILKDSQGSESLARQAATELLEQGDLCGVIGGTLDSEINGFCGVWDSLSAPLIVIRAAMINHFEMDDNQWLIGSPFTDHVQAAAGFIMNSLQARSIAVILDEDDEKCVKLATLFSAEILRRDGKIVDIIFFRKTDGDMGNIIQKLISHNPEAIYMPYSYESCYTVIKQVRKQGIKTPFVITNPDLESKFLTHAHRSFKEVYLLTVYHEQKIASELRANFVKRYKKQNDKLDTIAVLAADAYFVLLDMLQADGKMAQGFTLDNDGPYLSGVHAFKPSGIPVRDMHVSVVKNSRLKYVETHQALMH